MEFSLLRLVVYLVLATVSLLVPFQIFALYLEAHYPMPLVRGIYYFTLTPYVGFAAGILSALVYYGMVAVVERRPVSELRGPRPIQALLAGLLLGVGLMAADCGILALLRSLSFGEPPPPLSLSLLHSAMRAAGAAVVEEVIFRGILFRLLQQGFGTGVALALSSLLFGLLHRATADGSVSLAGTLSIAIEAGLPLAMAYTATQRLWLPIGLHFGWDLAFGQLFGQPGTGLLVLSGDASGFAVLTLSALPNVALAAYFGWKTWLKGLWHPAVLRLRLASGRPQNPDEPERQG